MDNALTVLDTKLQSKELATRAELKRRFSNSDLMTALIPEDIVVPDEPVFLPEWGEDLTLKKQKPSVPPA